MGEFFDPHQLTPAASTNSVVVAYLPDSLPRDASIIGKRADELISLAALNRLILAHADALNLPEDLRNDEHSRHLPLWFDTRFESANAATRHLTQQIADEFGRRIGALIAVLVRGDEANRTARVNTLTGYWEHWSTVQKIILGGGLLAGHLGEQVIPHVRATLRAAQVEHVVVEHDLHFDALPMFGAARTIVPQNGESFAPVFDFGRSTVKRGLAVYQENNLVELKILPTLPAGMEDEDGQILQESSEGHLARMVGIMTETLSILQSHGVSLAGEIAVSIAAYVHDGNIANRAGGYYTHLRDFDSPLDALLSARMTEATGEPLRVHLMHDGTASALFYAGEENTAVISIGTSIATGFTPHETEGFCPLANDLKLSIFYS